MFLSLSLSILTGFILMLVAASVQNACKVRLECGLDTTMNSVFSEYHKGLLEKYDLLYVDASYLDKEPAIENVRERILYYLKQNTERNLNTAGSPWGSIHLEKVEILSFDTAVCQGGASIRNQALRYLSDRPGESPERQMVREASLHISQIQQLDQQDPMGQWSALMEQLAAMELPRLQNQEGLWEEIPLGNPADWVFALGESHIPYLAQIDMNSVNSVQIDSALFSGNRYTDEKKKGERSFERDQELFVCYLFEKMSCLRKPGENALIQCQIEYLANGDCSDWLNVKGVAERIFRWRFADNVSKALADSGLYAQALAAAEELKAVQLKREFQEPVAKSILYACAFLESIGDLREIYGGGRIPAVKSVHNMQVKSVLSGMLYCTKSETGLSYEQYLASILLMEEETQLNIRVMEMMEMDIKAMDNNPFFSMCWCIERLRVSLTADVSSAPSCCLERQYGYY